MANKIILRRDTAQAWLNANPILSNGEIGLETDTGRFKIGNGVQQWSERPFYADAEYIGGMYLDTMTTKTEQAAASANAAADSATEAATSATAAAASAEQAEDAVGAAQGVVENFADTTDALVATLVMTDSETHAAIFDNPMYFDQALDELFGMPTAAARLALDGLYGAGGSESTGIAAITTTERNALTGDELAPGRIIFNITTQSHEIWRSDFNEWHVGTDAPGTIKEWAGTTIPTGWLKMTGQELPRNTYSALFARISTTYGPGNGSTTFNLPNRAGKVGVDVNGSHALGTGGGQETVALSAAQSGLRDHTHTIDHNHASFFSNADTPDHSHTFYQQAIVNGGVAGGGALVVSSEFATGTGGASDRHFHEIDVPNYTGSSGGSGALAGAAHENMQPYISSHFLIKV